MLSKIIKEKIHHRFGNEVRYPKDCESLAQHISHHCKTPISGSTLRRLYGFVKGIQEPRQYTLDIIAQYLGHKGWPQLLASLEGTEQETEKLLEKLKPEQIRKGQSVVLTYEPAKKIELRKSGTTFLVVSSNEKKLHLNDEVRFRVLELHYPLTFTYLLRNGESIGRVQLAIVSGIISIQKL
ncbi:MAG: hypothetical protein U0T74_15060 [Chitinophagales bacterium]